MFQPGTKPISEVLRSEVLKVGFILKNFLCITHRWSEIFLFGSYFIPTLGFSFILLFLHLTILKVLNFQMWLTKSRATLWFMTEYYSKRKSNISQELPLTEEQQQSTNRCWPQRLSLRSIKLRINFLGVFPWFLLALWSEHLRFCASLITYSLLTARNSKAKVFTKYQSGSCQDGLKLQNTAMQLLSYNFLTNIKL